jgi:hypothetical protein
MLSRIILVTASLALAGCTADTQEPAPAPVSACAVVDQPCAAPTPTPVREDREPRPSASDDPGAVKPQWQPNGTGIED